MQATVPAPEADVLVFKSLHAEICGENGVTISPSFSLCETVIFPTAAGPAQEECTFHFCLEDLKNIPPNREQKATDTSAATGPSQAVFLLPQESCSLNKWVVFKINKCTFTHAHTPVFLVPKNESIGVVHFTELGKKKVKGQAFSLTVKMRTSTPDCSFLLVQTLEALGDGPHG